MNIINQRTDRDCVIACIAMWTCNPYEEILSAFEGKFGDEWLTKYGVTSDQQGELLRYFGIIPVTISTCPTECTGILSFPSLNVPAGGHALFWSNGKVYDPQNGREGKKFYTNEMLNGLWPGCYKFTGCASDETVALFARSEAKIILSRLRQAGNE